MDERQPAPGFNWDAVAWDAHNEQPSLHCSYCDAPLGDMWEEAPFMLLTRHGASASFCGDCRRRWWETA